MKLDKIIPNLIRKRKYKEVAKKVSQEETKKNTFLPDIKA